MEDVSNKTIVALLAIALVVTVVGTIVSVSKLGDLGGKYAVLSGAVTTTGTTSITLAGTAAISIAEDNAVDYGSGYVSVGSTAATLDSSVAFTSWTGWTNTTSPTMPDSMLINNTGSTMLKVNISSETTAHAEGWLCTGSACTTNTAALQVKVANRESGSCTANGAPQSTYANLLTNSAKVTVPLCTEWDYSAGADSLDVYYQATVPNDAGTGAHTVTLTFTAVDSTA